MSQTVISARDAARAARYLRLLWHLERAHAIGDTGNLAADLASVDPFELFELWHTLNAVAAAGDALTLFHDSAPDHGAPHHGDDDDTIPPSPGLRGVVGASPPAYGWGDGGRGDAA